MAVWEQVRDLENENAALSFQLEAQVAEMAELVAENAELATELADERTLTNQLTAENARLQAIIDGTLEEEEPAPVPVLGIKVTVPVNGQVLVVPTFDGVVPDPLSDVGRTLVWFYGRGGSDTGGNTQPWESPDPAVGTAAARRLDKLHTDRTTPVYVRLPDGRKAEWVGVPTTDGKPITTPVPTLPPAPAPTPVPLGAKPLVGVYPGPRAQENWIVDGFENLVGHKAQGELVFAGDWAWDAIELSSFSFDPAVNRLAAGRTHELICTVATLPLSVLSGSWENNNNQIAAFYRAGARGEHGGHYEAAGRTLAGFIKRVAQGRGIPVDEAAKLFVVDPDHEMGGGWFAHRWAPDIGAAIQTQRNYHAAVRVGLQAAGVNPNNVRWMWRNVVGRYDANPNLERVWNDLADIMNHPGVDIYDQAWDVWGNHFGGPNYDPAWRVANTRTRGGDMGLDFVARWGDTHPNHSFIFGEWALWGGGTQYGGGGDCAEWMDVMFDFFHKQGVYAGRSYKVRSHYYFNVTFDNTDGGAVHELKSFPRGTARFKARVTP